MTSYAPVAVSGDVIRGQQLQSPEGDDFNGNGGVRTKWWWRPGPVDSCCCCCSLRTGVGLLAVDDVRSGIWILFFSRAFYFSSFQTALAFLQDQYAGQCEGSAASTPHCEQIHRTIEQTEGVMNVVLHLPMTEYVLGVVCFVASAVGLWAVIRQSQRAAKMYMLTWPIKFLLAVWTTVGFWSLRNEYGVDQGPVGIQWLINVFVLLYCCKVSWSYYKETIARDNACSRSSSAVPDTPYNAKPILAMNDNT